MKPTSAPVKLVNVQVLRAYGALAVAFYHTGFPVAMGRPIGSFGVGIFFVISGFIMAMICDSNPEHFLARRIARIVPLYWLLTLMVFFLALLVPRLLGGTVADPASVLKSLFFIPYRKEEGFFPVLFLGWSLNYEMYFYVLIAVALLIHKRRAALIAALTMTIVFLVLRAIDVTSAAVFYAQPIIFEFVAGILCYYAFRAASEKSISNNRTILVGFCGLGALGMIAASIFTRGGTTLLLVGIASTILVSGAVLLDKVGFSLRWPLPILLGDASYVIYLIHPYIQQAMNRVLAKPYPILDTRTLAGMLLSMTVTVTASIAVYKLVDNPLHIFFRRLLSQPKKLVTVNQVPASQPSGPQGGIG